ncbi:tetratricopeptide repeat protein [Roseobacter weihaiensis]|uniref:tetratricopeptide repeat protein n=1 Tax=Roseobacter weihaiensis TaxID=2763262 RepID=UPI001D0B7AA9|nr:tetratricopeptide repeat protein [Roseobacter sp. H9]
MRGLALIAALALMLAVALGGSAPFGRVLMALGMPGPAAAFLDTAAWQGAASYRAGDFDAAAARFTEAQAFYNLGNAEVQRGRYAAALEAYDLARARGQPDAQANFDVVSAFYAGLGIDPDALGLFPERKDGPEAEGFIARGDGRAAGTGSEVTNNNTMLGLAELESRGRLGVRRIFDDKFMVADARWLEQLADVPGEYLAARIALEHKRRVKLGMAPPDPEDPR